MRGRRRGGWSLFAAGTRPACDGRRLCHLVQGVAGHGQVTRTSDGLSRYERENVVRTARHRVSCRACGPCSEDGQNGAESQSAPHAHWHIGTHVMYIHVHMLAHRRSLTCGMRRHESLAHRQCGPDG